MTKILRDIAEKVGFFGYKPDDDVEQLVDKLREHLEHISYLIVIDDLWNARHWETIRLALLNNNCGSRILTTTRSVIVAKKSSSQGGSLYGLQPLSPGDSKVLFSKRAFCSDPNLQDVPDKIIEKCGGLPLAIITISSMLTDKHSKNEWDRVLNAIGSAFTNDSGAEDMKAILSLSYTDIPHYLRTCLLYLSLFPEDHVIRKEYLINRWIAEGFIQNEQGRSAYETGESYFNELINRCMIQPVNVEYDQAKACRVHDIILDYIKCKAAEENFATSLDASENKCNRKYSVRRLYVNNDNGENGTICVDVTLSHVRSFIIVGKPWQTSLSPFKALRVLHLDLGDDDKCEDHLEGIEKLFHLKYLSLSGWMLQEFPEKIGELQNLQTLDLQDTSISAKLPLTYANLQKLAHLYLPLDIDFPEGVIGQMHNLEVLMHHGVGCYEEWKSLQELSKLTKLRTLKIKWFFEGLYCSGGTSLIECSHSYVGTLLSSCSLHNLYMESDKDEEIYSLSLESWHPATPCSLKQLWIERYFIYKVPDWMGSLGNLEVLKLQIMCVKPKDVEILGAISSLLFLKLVAVGGTKGKIIVHGSNGFRNVKYFSLHFKARGTALEFGEGSMPKLEHFKVELYACEMGCLNGASNFGIHHLSALSKVEVVAYGSCSKYIISSIDATVKTLPNRPIVRFTNLPNAETKPFENYLREINENQKEELTKWLKLWKIEEEQTKEPTDGWRDWTRGAIRGSKLVTDGATEQERLMEINKKRRENIIEWLKLKRSIRRKQQELTEIWNIEEDQTKEVTDGETGQEEQSEEETDGETGQEDETNEEKLCQESLKLLETLMTSASALGATRRMTPTRADGYSTSDSETDEPEAREREEEDLDAGGRRRGRLGGRGGGGLLDKVLWSIYLFTLFSIFQIVMLLVFMQGTPCTLPASCAWRTQSPEQPVKWPEFRRS